MCEALCRRACSAALWRWQQHTCASKDRSQVNAPMGSSFRTCSGLSCALLRHGASLLLEF